jgi:hypothetical protein
MMTEFARVANVVPTGAIEGSFYGADFPQVGSFVRWINRRWNRWQVLSGQRLSNS